MTQNPYETPRYESAEQTAPELNYYCTVSSKLTLRECRNLAKNWIEFFVLAIFKILHIRVPMTHAIPEGQVFERIEPAEVSEAARQNLEPAVAEALALGMQYGFTYKFVTLGTIEAYAVALQSDDGCVLTSIIYFRHWNALVTEERVRSAFMSFSVDGGILTTSNSKPDLQRPPNYDDEYHPGRPLPEVLARHRARLAELKSALTPIQSLAELEQVIARQEREEFDYVRERGVFRQINAQKIERLRRLATSVKPPAGKVTQQPVLGWISFVCWIVLFVSLFSFPGPPANQAQATFRTATLLLALSGIFITSLLRFVMRDRTAA